MYQTLPPPVSDSVIRAVVAGDSQARETLFTAVYDLLLRIVRNQMRGFPRLREWTDSNDVLHSAIIRLLHSLEKSAPGSAHHFLALAGLAIRRELLDLSRRYACRITAALPLHPGCAVVDHPTESPSLDDWTWFHEEVERLPGEERDVFHCLWYRGFDQQQTAQELDISRRTVQLRLTSARNRLSERLSR